MKGLEQEILQKAITDISNKFEAVIIKGIELKGHKFDNRDELNEFVKNNCSIKDFVIRQERIYYIKDIPFMIEDYSDYNNISQDRIDGELRFIAHGTSYAYV